MRYMGIKIKVIYVDYGFISYATYQMGVLLVYLNENMPLKNKSLELHKAIKNFKKIRPDI